MILRAAAAWLRRMLARRPPPPLALAIEEWVCRLDPRVVLVVGSAVSLAVRGSIHTIFLGCGEAPVPPAKDVRVFPEDPIGFFDRADLSDAVGPRHGSVPPDMFIDLVLLDADGVTDIEQFSMFLRRAAYVGHSSMVAVVTSAHVGGTDALHASLIDARRTAHTVTAACADGEARLYADLHEAAAAGSIAPAREQTLDAFLSRHRYQPLPLAPEGPLVTGAPEHASEVVQPHYRQPGVADPVEPGASRSNRALASWWNKPFATLPLDIREYRDVRFLRASGHRASVLVDAQGCALPASHSWTRGFGPDAPTAARTTGTSFLVDDRNGRRLSLAAWNEVPIVRRVARPCVLLGHVDHIFGHALVESQSRWWAIDWALARGHGLALWWNEPALPYQRDMLRLLDLPPGSVEVAHHGTLFERLLVPAEGFRVMNSIAPAVADGWHRIGRAAEQEGDGTPTPSRVYLSRRNQRNRAIRNVDAFEALLARHGFAIVVPEALPFAEQVRIVRGADHLVACFGSQSHLSMYMRPGTRKLIVAREYFNGPEETLIALACGNKADFYIEPQRKGKPSTTRAEAWTISLDRFEGALTSWLGGADG